MIVNLERKDIFGTPHQHIAFAVNTEGANDAGFAGAVSSRYWPELADIGPKPMGTVLVKKAKGKTFHAIVCHSLNHEGWKKTPQVVTGAINKLDVPKNEVVGCVLMGAGMIGQMQGADVLSILGGLARSETKLAVYTL